jgi:hypothetical protein
MRLASVWKSGVEGPGASGERTRLACSPRRAAVSGLEGSGETSKPAREDMCAPCERSGNPQRIAVLKMPRSFVEDALRPHLVDSVSRRSAELLFRDSARRSKNRHARGLFRAAV